MITYHCYKTCPICGKTTLRLIDGTAERGLWVCEGKFHPAGWAIGCPGRVDERADQMSWRNCTITRFVHAHQLAQTGAVSRESAKQRIIMDESKALAEQRADTEAKKRKFWDKVARRMRCQTCPVECAGDTCAENFRAYYERNFGGGR